MTEDTPMGRGGAIDVAAAERAELARHIDVLMAEPARPWPSIIVVGDDAVFAITPAQRA
jgi:hypothetical protein